MQAFEYMPREWPPEEWFDIPPRQGQLKYLRKCRESGEMTGAAFRLLFNAICEAYGLPEKVNCGSCMVVIDFLGHATAGQKRAAERCAWEKVYG